MSQQDIAAKLGASKMTISRLLQKAREKEIIQITIKLPFQVDKSLSQQLKSLYDLEEAIVVKKTSNKDATQ